MGARLNHRVGATGLFVSLSLVAGTLAVSGRPAVATVVPASTWTQQNPTTNPAGSAAASMAYDSATNQLVLFGGYDGALPRGDTWIWDGTNWTHLTPAASPPARYGASMVYDPGTAQLVLFGGNDVPNGHLMSDTWTWDGTNWTLLRPAASPSARKLASMAYDPGTARLVLFGGDTRTRYGDTWTWDGTNWTQLTPITSPPARSAASMAYDPVTAQLVLFGGSDNSLFLGDTWAWDGMTWTELTPAASPPARAAASMANNSGTAQLVLFGGKGNGNDGFGLFLSDMWTWDGTTWVQLTPATSPRARFLVSMAYDPVTAQLVLFGGGTFSFFTDTWTYGPPVTADRAIFTNLVDGQTNVDITKSLTWSSFAGAQSYYLVVGTTPGGYDLANSGVLPPTQTSYNPPELPTGASLYATLLTEVNGAWRYQVVTFTAAALRGASFTIPVDGQQNVNTAQPLTWAAAAGAHSYYMVVGTTPGGYDLANSGILPNSQTSYNVPELPTGTSLYATLLTEFNGTWTHYQVVAFTAAVSHATFTHPIDSQTNVATPGPFSWTALAGAQNYYLVVGTTPGGIGMVNSGILPKNQTSFSVPALPTGTTLYATVLTEVNGTWERHQVISFTAA